jgi:hypothetical protein
MTKKIIVLENNSTKVGNAIIMIILFVIMIHLINFISTLNKSKKLENRLHKF